MTMSSQARGVVYVHSAPRALCTHVEWALGSLLGAAVNLEWTDQPVTPGTMRADVTWVGKVGTAATIASSLRGYPHLRFEVTEEPTAGNDGHRFVSTPSLGLWRSPMGAFGQTFITEERMRSAVNSAVAEGRSVVDAVDDVLGGPWDRELEPFRYAGDGVPVRWLHQVG